jgi:AraC-like DNA-binding protein
MPINEALELIIDRGFAVVNRKHKQRQGSWGPTLAECDELFIVLRGTLEFYMGERWVVAPPRSLGYFPEGVRYGIRHQADDRSEAHVVSILFRPPRGWKPQFPAEPVSLPGPWLQRFLDLEGSCDYNEYAMRVLPVDKVIAFVDNLAGASGRRTRAREAIDPKRADTEADWMEIWARAEEVIRQRAGEGLTVAELAEAVHASPTQLRRVFVAARGQSPKAALTAWRIDEAKRLLASGECNVAETAKRVGFATVQRFCAVFKASIGKSPGAFARRG